ncbi:MAG: response regulator [Caulobacterales bacterium]|nr:response regulator [Caulobacterales bacterium]
MAARDAPYVLVAEENLLLQEIFERVLGDAGFEVASVGDGEALIAAMKARPPVLVLLELILPRMDGFECLRRIRAEPALKMTPVVVITALTRDDHFEALQPLGVLAYVTKPFSPSALVRQLGELGIRGAPT